MFIYMEVDEILTSLFFIIHLTITGDSREVTGDDQYNMWGRTTGDYSLSTSYCTRFRTCSSSHSSQVKSYIEYNHTSIKGPPNEPLVIDLT